MKSDSIPARICVYSTSLSISSVVLVITVVVAQLILNWINKDYAVLTPPPSLPDKASVTVSHSLVHFPTEVSWFSSKPPGDDVDADFQHPVPLQSSLDDHTLAIVKKKLQVQDNLKKEAHASYKAAVEMVEHGKVDKAKKLLNHALALDPLDPDILNAYGELLENTDIVMADHMFKQAIMICPQHSRALSNIKRTAPVVVELDSQVYNRIDNKRDILMHIPESHPALRRLKKELYYKHIYHTVAIEGNTLNLHQTRSIIETRMSVGGKSIFEHNEVLGMDAALSYINSTLLNRIGRISVNDILEIHRRVLGFVDPIEAGQMRNTQVFVGDYTPPRPGEVQALMDEFIEWLNSDDALALHPIKLAALSHYKLVTIHPFYDGNGRTSRLLMNLVLMHAGYPPVLIRVEQKHIYYKHLETANQGDIRPFIRFIADCAEATIDEYIIALSTDDSLDVRSPSYVDDGRTIIMEPDN